MFGIGQSIRRKPRQFNYNPRYYDAEQEARNQRRIELGHAPREAEGEQQERKPGDILRARSARRQQEAERNIASRKQSNKLRLLFVALLIVGLVMLAKSIVETFNF